MCGIAGFLGPEASEHVLHDMMSTMLHRGPDGQGVWTGADDNIALGHLRLSIIDLDHGGQPMTSPDGRYVFVYNGEVYNYAELRGGLEQQGWQFRTDSDSEVLMAGLILEDTGFLIKTIGMFAFALWDRKEKELLLARDRMGIKPLYYTLSKQTGLVFSSEFKALVNWLPNGASVNPSALDDYLTLRYVAGPKTMVAGINKFPAGHWVRLGYDEILSGSFQPVRWWSMQFNSTGPAFTRAEDEELEFLLEDAVRLCMRSDVPFGAFLSGGIDSGVVAGLMARHHGQAIRTYSIGFEGEEDELAEAAQVAHALNAKHSEVVMRPEDLRSLPDIVHRIDEPFPDPIVIAMDMLAARSAEDVKVILTGEGADEIFGGYVHHPHMQLFDCISKVLPKWLTGTAGAGVNLIPIALLDAMVDYQVKPGKLGRDRLAKIVVNLPDKARRYLTYVGLFPEDLREVLVSSTFHPGQGEATLDRVSRTLSVCEQDGVHSFLDQVMAMEYETWLTDNILFKQDKVLMGHSLEGRVPFCDHRLVELAAKLPLGRKLKRGRNKIALRDMATKILPSLPQIGKKKAFMIPMNGAWGGVLREMAGDYLLSTRFRQSGIFCPKTIDKLLSGFPSSTLLEGKQILALMMFAMWQDRVLIPSA
ncbi:asparagine synthase (glutamine-hydrolyzing) [Thalassospira sp.]|uniref:asparagine synthase (glutamine-hydrolyzing) n=1 Tax=Thalassospira sp. TaxID=1912094 RepID=UPI0032EFCC01